MIHSLFPNVTRTQVPFKPQALENDWIDSSKLHSLHYSQLDSFFKGKRQAVVALMQKKINTMLGSWRLS